MQKHTSSRAQIVFMPLALLLALWLTGCTTSSWVILSEPEPDPDSETELSSVTFIQTSQIPEPQNPVIVLDLVRERQREFNQHLVSQRYIQQYRPRYGYVMLGTAATGLGLYLTNSAGLGTGSLSARERALLNTASVAVGAASFLAMQPSAEPREAGERRYLQQVESLVLRDTVAVDIPPGHAARLTIRRGDQTLVDERPVPMHGNRIIVQPALEAGLLQLEQADTTNWVVRIGYENLLWERELSVPEFMQSYVQITAGEVPVRSDPVVLSGNIIRHVAAESRFLHLGDINDRWYRVLNQGNPAYIEHTQAVKIWRAAGVASAGDLVLSPGRTVFGDLDIERGLPDNRGIHPEAIAIVIANGDYAEPLRRLPNAARTAELTAHHLNRVMGYYADNIVVMENVNEQELRSLLEQSDSLYIGTRHISPAESDIFIYYYGHAYLDDQGRLQLLPVDYDPSAARRRSVAFEELADVLSSLQARQLVMVMDTDLSVGSVYSQDSTPGIRPGGDVLGRLSEPLTSSRFPVAIYWAASPGQLASPYIRRDGQPARPYDIFTWYFFAALKQGASTTGEVEQYLQRQVPFTSRRLHDRPQDPGFVGDRRLRLFPAAP